MEADWDVEIGPDAPAIVVPWDGFIDLRSDSSSAVETIAEASSVVPLRDALIRLNSRESRTFTSKCDVWWLTSEVIDHDEFGTDSESAAFGFASYIDVLLLEANQFASFRFHERLVKQLAGKLRTVDLANCRVDLVVRASTVDSCSGYGITVYTAGCGQSPGEAQTSWQEVLQRAVNATIENVPLCALGE